MIRLPFSLSLHSHNHQSWVWRSTRVSHTPSKITVLDPPPIEVLQYLHRAPPPFMYAVCINELALARRCVYCAVGDYIQEIDAMLVLQDFLSTVVVSGLTV